jgi:hypothetical protein
MKRLTSWIGGILLALVALATTAHAATSAEAHAIGQCIACNLHDCLMSMFL